MTKDKMRLENDTVLLNVHTQDQCAGQPCCVHNPSNHHMLTWPGDWEPLFKQMWRTCPHNMTHPDPDDLQFHRAKFGDDDAAVQALHACDGCCQPGLTLPKEISDKVSDFLQHPDTGTVATRPVRDGTLVSHKPQWESALLQTNARGDTRPGFVCTHELENGRGQCGGNVFYVQDAVGDHSCWLLP